MKKIIYIFSILIGLFIFGINVEAKTEESSTYNYNLKFINYNDLSDSEKNNLVYTYNSGTATINLNNYFKLFIDYFNNQTKYDSYFIYSGNGSEYGGIMFLFNKEETLNSVFLTYVYSNPKNMRLSLLSNNFANYYYYMSYKGYVTYNSIPSSWKYTSEIYNNKSYTNIFSNLIFSNSTGFTPTEVYYASNYIEDIIYTTDLKFDSSDSSTKYNNVYYNDELLFSNGNSVLNNTPEVNIKTIYKDSNKEQVKVNFTIFDTDKYLYFYRTSSNSKSTWIDILNNDFEYTSYSNYELYVIVVDKAKYVESAENGQELVYDVIASNVYTFSILDEIIPDLTFSLDIPDSCYLTISGNREIVCKRLTVKTINYNDMNKYRFEYSNDKVNFLTLYSTDYVNTYSENSTIVFRLYDVLNDEYIKTITYNLDGISKNMSSLGPYVKLNGKYNEEEYLYEISAYFYNYDSSLYNYYYSIDREEWLEIDPLTVNRYINNGINSVYTRNFKIYESCTFYLKIEDKDGNYIYSITFTVDLDEYVDTTFFLDKVTDFLNSLRDYSNYFNELFDMFFGSLPNIIQSLSVVCWIIFHIFFGLRLGGWL